MQPDNLFARCGRSVFEIESWKQVAEAYVAALRKSGALPSQAPRCLIVDASGKTVARVSYTGMVWPGETYRPGDRPIYPG